MYKEELKFQENLKKYKCKDCDYWVADYDCGHANGEQIICGDFLKEQEESE